MPAEGHVRLFVATSLPAEEADHIMAVAGDVLGDPVWRAAPIDQWHVTALFIGDRPAGLPVPIAERVAAVAGTSAPVRLEGGRLTTMPKDDPRMLWVRFAPSPALTALHHRLAQAVGAPPSIHRPYWPHITLARARATAPPLIGGPLVLDHLVLARLTLFRSDPGVRGRTHTAVAEWPLTGKGPTAPGEVA